MLEIDYEQPTSLREAIHALSSGEARALAGGTDLIVQLREHRRYARRIVDLKKIPELTELTREADGSWRIGAATSVLYLGRNQHFATEHRALLESARLIGSLQIQSRASLGGNVCNAAPSADAVPLLYSLSAVAVVVGPAGERQMLVSDIAVGPGQSVLREGELLVAIVLPPKQLRSAEKYLRFTPRREMDIAIAGSGVSITLNSAGVIVRAAVTLASVAPKPLVANTAAKMLIDQKPTDELFTEAGFAAASDAQPITDTRGSAEYRRHIVSILTKRALEACALELGSLKS